MFTENFLKPGITELHVMLNDFLEEVKKDCTIIEEESKEKFEK